MPRPPHREPCPSRSTGDGFRCGSVWPTGQTCSRVQRRGRYVAESIAHPAKMLPAIARHAIATYTQPGDLVLDPMAGIGTTTVEAMHLGRRGIGVEYEQRWAGLAANNIRHATRQGATGTGQVWRADSRDLTRLLPLDVIGQVALVLTSPPYGPYTHGHVREYAGPDGKLTKRHHRYGEDPDNLAHRQHDELAAGFTAILRASTVTLRPGGHVVVTARPYRVHGELIDIPGMVIAAGHAAGLHLHDRCVALIAGVRRGRLVPRGSFFQLRNIREARRRGDPQWLTQHEDVLCFVRSDAPGCARA
ncbi:MAG: TRM11 family SAM-dependent methyltransferase [Stackebrandtia sp.]